MSDPHDPAETPSEGSSGTPAATSTGVPPEASPEAEQPVTRLGRSMLSIKQIEAFYWSGRLGSFIAASRRLNTTQSNISKRIQELELTLGILAFDRSKRAIRLTRQGEEVMWLSEVLLKAHMRLSSVGAAVAGMSGPFRFGVTEAVALTWLPAYLAAVGAAYPRLVPEPRIGTTRELNLALRDSEIDLLLGTEEGLDRGLETLRLGEMARVPMAHPRLGLGGRRLTIEELSRVPMIGHTEQSAGQRRIARAMSERGPGPNVAFRCSSLGTRARMAMAGIGIAFLPREVFAGDVAAGRLEILDTELERETLRYLAAWRGDVTGPSAALLAGMAREHCDFTLGI